MIYINDESLPEVLAQYVHDELISLETTDDTVSLPRLKVDSDWIVRNLKLIIRLTIEDETSFWMEDVRGNGGMAVVTQALKQMVRDTGVTIGLNSVDAEWDGGTIAIDIELN